MNIRFRFVSIFVPTFAAAAFAGCGGNADDTPPASTQNGAGASAGAAGSGGSSAAGTSGVSGTGGVHTGGSSTAGSPGAGGASGMVGAGGHPEGGSQGGSPPGVGGTSPSTGGHSVGGGQAGVGGTPSAGGNASTGGNQSTGGSPGTGGTGGSESVGGSGVAGSFGTGGSPGCDPLGEPDCACQAGSYVATCEGSQWACVPPPACAMGTGGVGQGGCSATGGSGGIPSGGFAGALIASPVNPPIDPKTGAAAESTDLVLATRKLYLGDTDWDGNASDSAWELYGYEIDGKAFPTAMTPGHCKPQMNAAAADITPDGPSGRDNSFGKTIIPLLSGFVNDPSQTEDDAMASGLATILVKIHGVGPLNSYEGLTTQIFAARGSDANGQPTIMPVAPTDQQWSDGTYVWHPDPSGVLDPTAPAGMITAKNIISGGYTVGDLFVSGAPSTIRMPLSLAGNAFFFDVDDAIIMGTLSADRRSITHGQLGGIVPAERLAQTFKQAAASISTSFCQGSTVDGILNTVRGAADVMHDGTQDPSQVCDAISFGVGFDADTAHLGTAAPDVQSFDPCGCP